GAWLETINYNTKLVTGADAPKSCRLMRRAARAVVCVLHAVVVIPMASKPSESQAANSLWARAMPRQTTPHRYSAPVSGILAPQRVSNLRIAQNCSSTSDCGGPSLQVIEPLSQSDPALSPLYRNAGSSVLAPDHVRGAECWA